MARTKDEFDKWFVEAIVKPTQEKWGVGWLRLSEDQQLAEIKGACFQNLLGQAHLDEIATEVIAGDTNASSAAMGRHVFNLAEAFRRWAVE